MIIQLNAEEMQNIVIAHLKNHIAGLGSIEGLNQRMGFVRGEYVCVVGISEEIPEGIFDGEDDDFTDHTFTNESDDSEESEDSSKGIRNTFEAKGENQNKKGSGNKRRRRTRAEIEADEAKQKEAESKQKDSPVEATPVEATVETPETQTEAQTPSDEDMFATTTEDTAEQPTDDGEPPFNVEEAEPVVEATQEAVTDPDDLFADAGATANPFADNNAEAVEEDSLFSTEPVEQTKVVEQSEAGFSKPVENNPLELFS